MRAVTFSMVDLPVAGGTMRAGIWGDGGPLVVAAHGITSQHRHWAEVGPELGRDHRFVALDVRGRGGSRDLPAPYGTDVHAADVAAVVAHLGEGPVILVGHSMGAMVMAKAARLPGVARSVVLADGGPLQQLPAGFSSRAEAISRTIGPAFARLSRTFASVEEYLEFWRVHPSLSDWTAAMTDFVEYDLVPAGDGRWRPACVRAAAERDADDLYSTTGEPEEPLGVPAVFLRAERGMLDQPDEPFYRPGYASAYLPGVVERDVPGTNHYTITLGAAGAAAVAAAVRELGTPGVLPFPRSQ